jgi:LacI family transcriptional regulator
MPSYDTVLMQGFISADVTIRDVARHAGVSITTASYALNETGRVSTGTRAKVLEAAEALGYAPSIAARLMRGVKGNLIAVLTEGLAGPWYGEILEGLQPTINSRGFAVVAMTMQKDSVMLSQSLASAGLLRGVVVLNPEASWAPLLLRLAQSIPTVLFDPAIRDIKAIRYVLDNRGGILELMNHLWDRGYRDYLWLDGDLEAAWDARERFEAFYAFLDEKGLPSDRRRRSVGGFKTAVAEKSVSAILGRGEVPRVIVAANDESAIGALNAIRRFGLRVPEDIAVAGFDGLDISAWMNPPLTTLRYDRRALGESMAHSVMDAMEDGAMDERTTIPLTLVVGGST